MMNPYDFVSIDWGKPPIREKPIWHYQLVGPNQQKLYHGHIEIAMQAETPLIIHDPHAKGAPTLSLRNKQGEYIIPGSSLKGMLRCVVETLARGCLTLFDGTYTDRRAGRTAYYRERVDKKFLRCSNNNELCLSCRIFGMMRPGKREDDNTNGDSGSGKNLFLGKITIGDACASRTSSLYEKMYTENLLGPKPHHDAFYLDVGKQAIAGRKYYFHHAALPHDLKRSTGYNSYIQPLATGTTFQVRIDFTSLTADEFAALLLAITLEEKMRHKIGYGKPIGLGSIYLNPQRMTLIDYSTRYTQPSGRGQTEYGHDGIMQLRNDLVNAFTGTPHLVPRSLNDLRRIWRWPADPSVTYRYPDEAWFKNSANSGKRIAQTP
jgi:hypothetical protein